MSLKFNFFTNADTGHSYFTQEALSDKLSAFKNIINNPQYGFFHLTDESDLIEKTKELANKFSSKKHFVQIGIGGSALGPQMLVSALRSNWDMSFSLLDNTDADYIHDELNKIDITQALFYVVSKSGGTAETIAGYSIARTLLQAAGIQKQDFKDYFVFCTDPTSGQLRKHVNDNGYYCLEVPSNIGGRFSVLSPVGLLPAQMLGIDIAKLFAGANALKAQLLEENTSNNPLLQTAAHIAYLFTEASPSVNETVLMPYSSKLKDFSFWFVQLWAESLGKFSQEDQKTTGITPVPAYGATDQHSQMQLFMEGTNNKTLFLLKVNKTANDFKLESDLEFDSAQKLKPYTLNQLIKAQFEGTVAALKENKRNIITLEIDTVSAENLGKLVLFFECLTALMGEYLKVDPFNQPGVELGKKYAFEFLKSSSK